MNPYAVVETGGKQYRVKANDTLKVEKLPNEEGESIKLTPVLAVSDGDALKVGTPVLEKASVSVKVVGHERGPKVVSFKKKRRKGHRKKQGHRQSLTVLRVESVNQG